MSDWRIRLEWKPQDCWIGAFWKTDIYETYHRRGDSPALPAVYERFHLWVCLLPMLPLHIFGPEKRHVG